MDNNHVEKMFAGVSSGINNVIKLYSEIEVLIDRILKSLTTNKLIMKERNKLLQSVIQIKEPI